MRRFGLKPQLLLLLLMLNLVSATVYTAVLYGTDRSEIIVGIDQRLRAAVHAVREMVPAGYHDRISGADSIATQDYEIGRASWGKSVSVRVDLGGRRIIKK